MTIGSIARAVLPPSLIKALRGKHGSIKTRFWSNPIELMTLGFYRLTGRNYLQWYAQRLDRFAAGESAVGSGLADTHRYYLSGDEDLETLVKAGMTPESTLFELGCGFGRSAQHFIKHLEPEHYVGSDISAERLRQCREIIEHRSLTGKKPTFIANKNNSFDWLDGKQFDFLWSADVFVHVPPEDVEEIVSNIRKAMHTNSAFLFTYSANEGGTMRRHHAKDWERNFEFFDNLANKHGYTAENVSDLLCGRGNHGDNSRLVRYVLKDAN